MYIYLAASVLLLGMRDLSIVVKAWHGLSISSFLLFIFDFQGTATTCIHHIIKHDYPSRWTAIVTKLAFIFSLTTVHVG